DDVVLVTTQAEADQNLRIRLYPVGDLVICGSEKDDSGRRCDFDSLIDVLQSTVIPNSWDDVGGPGSISPYEGGLALVISQNEEAHNQIEAILSKLRDVTKSQHASTSSKLLLRVYALAQRSPQQPQDEAA